MKKDIKNYGEIKKNISKVEQVCVQCGSPLYCTNGYEMDIIQFCCKLKCPNFGLLQLGSKSIFQLLEYEKNKNSKWVEIIEN